MHSLVIVAFDGVVALDMILPAEAFSNVRLADGTRGYQVKLCAVGSRVRTTVCPVEVAHGLRCLRDADTIVVPGIDRADGYVDERLLSALRRAAARGARIASLCSGAFVLARTGLLSGKRATTHWAAADELQRRHPDVVVDPNVLYVDHGNLLTSAGGMAQLDLCLHLIRRDYGSTVAAAAARLFVMPLERGGGQAQFIVRQLPTPEAGDSLAPLLEWIQSNLQLDLSVSVLARRAAMSERTFARRFSEQTGTTPAKWITHARVRFARELLESTALSVEHVAQAAGFGSAVAFRVGFIRHVGVPPAEYRKSFRRSSSVEGDDPTKRGSPGLTTLRAG